MTVRWNPVKSGNNFVVDGYMLKVDIKKKLFRNTPVFQKTTSKDVTEVKVPAIKPGQAYLIVVQTSLKDLDTGEIKTFEDSITQNTSNYIACNYI